MQINLLVSRPGKNRLLDMSGSAHDDGTETVLKDIKKTPFSTKEHLSQYMRFWFYSHMHKTHFNHKCATI